MKNLLVAGFVTVGLMHLVGLQAKTCFWSGEGELGSEGRKWSDTKNWVGEVCPVSGDSVVITNTSANNIINDIRGLTLVDLIYEAKGGTSSSSATILCWERVKLTGTGSRIASSYTKAFYPYFKVELEEGARLTLGGSQTMILAQDDMFTGTGEVAVWMDGDTSFDLSKYHPNFKGVFNIYKGNTVYMQSPSDGKIGFPQAVVNVYGDYAAEGTKSGFNGNSLVVTLYGEYHFRHKAGFTTQKLVTFDGDIYLHADADNDTFQFNPYGRTDPKAGFVFNGKVVALIDGRSAKLIHYTYGTTATTGHNDSIIEFNGGVEFGKYGITFSKQNGATGSYVRVGAPITQADGTYFHQMNIADRLYTTAPNVLPTNRVIMVGANNVETYGELIDLMGNDQKIGPLLIYSLANTKAVFTSSKGPATLSARPYSGTGNRFVPTLNGPISFRLWGTQTNAGATTFEGGDTTGWLASEWSSIKIEGVSFPNLAGIEVMGKANVLIDGTTELKDDIVFDIHDRDGDFIRVPTDVDVKAARVLAENVDVAAGTYCRTGAGIVGATEVAWMGNNSMSSASNYKGTITVAAHDPMLVWTGKGADAGLLTPGNWGANAAPDLTDTTLTLDFRRATAETPIALTGTVAPACVLSAGPLGQGRPTFAGTGALVLADAGTVTNNYTFTESSSLTWNGTGTLVLKGSASTTDGTLTVASGRVVLDASCWIGKVVVAAGAELEVLTNCGSEVFGAADGNSCVVELDGKLTLGEGIAAAVKELLVAGRLVRQNRTYGSTESAAEKTDDVHFGGTGTILSQTPTGLLLLVR